MVIETESWKHREDILCFPLFLFWEKSAVPVLWFVHEKFIV